MSILTKLNPVAGLNLDKNFDVDKSRFFSAVNSTNSSTWSGRDVDKIIGSSYLMLGENRSLPDVNFTPKVYNLFSSSNDKPIEVFANKSSYELSISNQIFPVALSSKHTPVGKFYVCEKWENPFWKSKNRLWVPGKNNPIGSYLIILSDGRGNKINAGIHQWIQWEYSDSNFKQTDNGLGCIRTRPEDLKDIFYKIPLGSTLYIE
ncbi:MAG: L,D-transpeptidase [Candidatus Woesearchaeota archaeon]